VSGELDREVNYPEKACKISANIELTSLTLLGTVVIFKEFHGSETAPWDSAAGLSKPAIGGQSHLKIQASSPLLFLIKALCVFSKRASVHTQPHVFRRSS
jgi:hypothetical protein